MCWCADYSIINSHVWVYYARILLCDWVRAIVLNLHYFICLFYFVSWHTKCSIPANMRQRVLLLQIFSPKLTEIFCSKKVDLIIAYISANRQLMLVYLKEYAGCAKTNLFGHQRKQKLCLLIHTRKGVFIPQAINTHTVHSVLLWISNVSTRKRIQLPFLPLTRVCCCFRTLRIWLMIRRLFILLHSVSFEFIVVLVFIQQSLKLPFIPMFYKNFCSYPFTILASFQMERESLK